MPATQPVSGSFPFKRRDWGVLLLSILVQLALGVFFGHAYDMRIFMATGYLVASGQNPYLAQDLTAVFQNSTFQGMTSIGYPPPWPLLLGGVYRFIAPVLPNLLVYNLAIKIPVIAANIGLAFVMVSISHRLGAREMAIRWSWAFLLLNPFLFYFSAAWGQFDGLVALLALSSLATLPAGRYKTSALLLALAVSLKPTALPILPVVLIYLWGISRQRSIGYAAIWLAATLLLCLAPFAIFRWDPSPILQHWNAHFIVGGALSFMTFFELLKDTYQLPGNWWLLGIAWIPAMGIALWIAARQGIPDFTGLLKKCTALVLVFFLTRTWLSEPNILLLLPLVLILTSLGELNRLAPVAICTIPLVFTIFNTSPPQLLFLVAPELMARMLQLADSYREARLVVRSLLVIPWQIAGWWIVSVCFRRSETANH